MRFQVPQFVDIQDKVIGPLTLRQFGFYLVAVLALIVLYAVVDIALLITLAIPLLGTAALFAHGKFYGQPFGTILLNALSYMTSEKTWLWRRDKRVKLLKISGQEYADIAAISTELPSSLNLISQALNTEGSITSEDAADPLLQEELSDSEKREQTVAQAAESAGDSGEQAAQPGEQADGGDISNNSPADSGVH